jgi:lysozyme
VTYLITELKRELLEDESVRLKVYDDASGRELKPGMQLVGHATVGIGRALDVRGISQAEAEYLLQNDIAEESEALLNVLPWVKDLDPVRHAVLLNMAFNLGTTGLLAFHETLSKIQAADWEGAAADMLASHWATEVGARATRLAERMRTGTAT